MGNRVWGGKKREIQNCFFAKDRDSKENSFVREQIGTLGKGKGVGPKGKKGTGSEETVQNRFFDAKQELDDMELEGKAKKKNATSQC